MPSKAAVVPRRERARAATIEEIKATALDLIREQGTTDLRFSDIARAMGLTAPALYRYFSDRDELLTALITDGYDSLGEHLTEAVEPIPEADIGARFLAAAQAYRHWARQEPQQHALILGTPVPGYQAPDEGPTTEAAERALSQLSGLFVSALIRGKLRRPLLRDVDPAVEVCAMAEGKAHEHGEELTLPPESFQAMLCSWASLHGFTCLEAYGHLDWMGVEARDALFLNQVRLIARTAGLPAPR